MQRGCIFIDDRLQCSDWARSDDRMGPHRMPATFLTRILHFLFSHPARCWSLPTFPCLLTTDKIYLETAGWWEKAKQNCFCQLDLFAANKYSYISQKFQPTKSQCTFPLFARLAACISLQRFYPWDLGRRLYDQLLIIIDCTGTTLVNPFPCQALLPYLLSVSLIVKLRGKFWVCPAASAAVLSTVSQGTSPG